MDTYSDKDKEIEVQLTPSSSSPSPPSSSLNALPKEQTLSKNNIAVNQLDIADGLKELLITHNLLSLESILERSSADLASILGIDQHVGEIISSAAKKTTKVALKYKDRKDQIAKEDAALVSQ